MKPLNPFRFILIAALFFTFAAQADVKLPAIFGDHMVLQRDQKVPVWGWADDGEKVTVEFAGQKVSATAKGGKWSLALTALKASSKGAAFTVTGNNKVEFTNVVVGEVWLCGGQSNMEWYVASSKDKAKEIAEGNHPLIRHIKVPHVTSTKLQDDVKAGPWQAATSQTVGNFTAVGYFFALQIQKDLDVPIGLIGSNWGGTRIEPWTPPVGFQSVPALKKDYADKLSQFPQTNAQGVANNGSPLAMYNAMIHPLVPYAIRGALWYQGESNNGEGMLYYEKKKALINGWRSVWNQGDFPFLFVQLAPFSYGGDPTRLAQIWEAQTATLQIKNTGMAVITDISTIKDIHPPNKQEVGRRLALWALAKTYGKDVKVYSGPLYKSAKADGKTIHVSFDHVGGGLASRDGKPLSHFQIAGEDGIFVAADAKVDGATVAVSSVEVSAPKFVRFGWHQDAEPNLSNKEGLPASPFRTDNLPPAPIAPKK
ncbi:MAG: sialate O-acetylesterase [Pedosphaera sp.]|nr:sialate O-acetylesterase [Pedosphaera sp.]